MIKRTEADGPKPCIRLLEKHDIGNLAILLTVALAIGVYLIATAVLIAKDGAFYIERAQMFSNDLIGLTKACPPGYPFLILAAHKFTALFADDSSVFTWIYSAQSVTLLCRLLAIIALYFMGKLLVGGRKSFWAILILIVLPYPATFGSDVMRDWPHILFLSTGLLFLIMGVRFYKYWMFVVAGLAAGLGHTIRPECAQIVVYGILWMLIQLFVPSKNEGRAKAAIATFLLLAGFAIAAGPYMKARGKIMPEKLEDIMNGTVWKYNNTEDINIVETTEVQTAGVSVSTLKALDQFAENIADNLIYVYVLPWAIGLFVCFRKLRTVLRTERFFVLALVLLYLVMTVMLYDHYGYIGRRHCMPIVVFTIFYVPVGLHFIARWLSERAARVLPVARIKRRYWFFLLMAVGVVMCAAKFSRIAPLRSEKRGYREASQWLRENTRPQDVIAADHRRIAFYAERKTKFMEGRTYTVSADLDARDWCHLVGTFDGRYQKLYIDGKLAASREPGFAVIAPGDGNPAIGKPYMGHPSHFLGSIEEVRLYDTALSDGDVEALYERREPAAGDDGLIGYWRAKVDVSGEADSNDRGRTFNGLSDYIDLSYLGARLDAKAISACVWVKPGSPDRVNWILGNGGQFHIGTDKSKALFWIMQESPGYRIPSGSDYVVAFVEAGSTEIEKRLTKRVQQRHSVWVDEESKKERIVIFEVL